MIWDDIIGLKASESNAVMETAITWVDNSRALERPLEGGNVLCNHTTWAYHDAYKHMEEKWPGEWVIYQRSLLENEKTGEPDDTFGVSIFPDKISTKKAYAMKAADEFVFAAQYMNLPKAGKSQSFQESWDGDFHVIFEGHEPVIHIDKTGGYDGFAGHIFEHDMADCPEVAPQRVPLSWCEKSIILDPAPSKGADVRQDRHARNAMVVCAVDPWGRKFNLDCRVSNDPPEEVMELLVSLARTWQAWTWSVEEVAFSAVYQPFWTSIMFYRPDMQDCHPDWVPVYTKGRDKDARIRNNLIKGHQSGLYYYNMGDPNDPSPGCPSGYLLKEKREFPHGQTKDCIDAWSYIEESIIKPETPEAIQSAWWRNQQNDRGITGYGQTIFGETS